MSGQLRKAHTGTLISCGRPLIAAAAGALFLIAAPTASSEPTAKPATASTGTDVSAANIGSRGAFVAEDNEVIIAVYLRRKTLLTDAMVAYIFGDDLLVPIEELMLLLEFSIKETATGASGWFIKEGRNFRLDLTRGVAIVEGKRYGLNAGNARRIDGELFVSAKRLSVWLPIDFRANFRASR